MVCVRSQSHIVVLVCDCLTSCACALRYSVMFLCSATGCLASCLCALRNSVVLLYRTFWIWPHCMYIYGLCWDSRGGALCWYAIAHVLPCIICWMGSQTGYGSVDSLGESAKINKLQQCLIFSFPYQHTQGTNPPCIGPRSFFWNQYEQESKKREVHRSNAEN
jgi:hypothetical protein